MVRLRLDARLHRRIDPSDVIQEAFVDAVDRFDEYRANPSVPISLWLRLLAGQKLLQLHRRHMLTQARNAGRELSLNGGKLAGSSSESGSGELAGRESTPSQSAMRSEVAMSIQGVLAELDTTDREILVLRHFEQVTNSVAASRLGISESAASKRYVRALRRFKAALNDESGLVPH